MAINMTFTDFVTPVPADWLNNVNYVVNNPAAPTYLAPYTGAVSRLTSKKLSDVVSVLDFGADSTGTLDSSAAAQAAHNTGHVVYYPAGTYKINSTVSMVGGGMIGDGQNSTFFNTTITATDLFQWNGAGSTTPGGAQNGPVFHGFTINAPVGASATAGALINLIPSVGEISYAEVYGITFNGGFDQFGQTAASHWKCHDCTFLNYNQAGILIQNTNNADSGDSCVYGNLFNCGFVGTSLQAGILHLNSSGTKIFGNKFLGGRFGYKMLAETLTSGGLGGVYITSNSMEDFLSSAIQLDRQSGTAGWGGIVIANNEIGGVPNGIVCNTTNFTSQVSVTGNIFTQMPAGGTGITVDNQFDWHISGNSFGGSSSSTIGISTGASMTSLHIGVNMYVGIATPVGISSPSQTTLDLTPQVAATVNVTTSTAYGTLFSGTGTITWPAAFTVAPTSFSHNIPTSGAGGVSVLVTSPTKTGATITVIGVTNGGSVPVSVTGFGIA